MENEKSWIGWFIEDWQKYSHALVLWYYLYLPFMVISLVLLTPASAGCILALVIGSVKLPVWRAIVTIGLFALILTVGFVIQWFWDRKKPRI